MKVIELTYESDGIGKINFIIDGNFTFYDHRVHDGIHNNGGWRVMESRVEILEKIKAATDF